MRQVTKLMINEFHIKKLGYDFMGYALQKNDTYTFHHLIVPYRECNKKHMSYKGFLRENGAILFTTPHEYLHVIEHYDYDMFFRITSELIEENMKGRLDVENIKKIHDILNCFEKEHCSTRTHKGKLIIKESYMNRMKF